MKLDNEILLNKSVNDLLKLCLKLNNDNEELRKKINTLKQNKASAEVKETNKTLRAENRKLRSKLDAVQRAIKTEDEENETK